MCKLEDNVSLWNAFISYEAYYTSKAPKPNKVAQISRILKHCVSELLDSMSNRKQKTLTNPINIKVPHIRTGKTRTIQSSKITQDYTLEHGTVCTVTGFWEDKRSGRKDLIIKSKNIWYITGGMDPGPAPAEKRDHLYHTKKWENDYT